MPNYSGFPNLLNRSEQTAGVPIGAIISVAWPTATAPPTGYLVCDGSPVNITDYPALFSVMQYGYGQAFLGVFNLPDFRNRFQRGHQSMDGRTTSSGLDLGPRSASAVGGSVLGNGSIEGFMFQGHWHEIFTRGALGDWNGGQVFNPSTVATNARLKEIISDGVSTPQVAAETRATNVTVVFLVRAF